MAASAGVMSRLLRLLKLGKISKTGIAAMAGAGGSAAVLSRRSGTRAPGTVVQAPVPRKPRLAPFRQKFGVVSSISTAIGRIRG